MKVLSKLDKMKHNFCAKKQLDSKCRAYVLQFYTASFRGNKCTSIEQYEAVITRWYHTIEKGLAYVNFRAGFGKHNINSLLDAMQNYVDDGYDRETFFFQTALSVLEEYIKKNATYNVQNLDIEAKIAKLQGNSNNMGGAIEFSPFNEREVQSLNYADFVSSRHSMRHFSAEPIEASKIAAVFDLAQHTPSACNRQGWNAIVVENKVLMTEVLKYQNGNEGFGHEFDKLILLTADLRYFNQDRELFQAFIDGGMYAQSVLNALHFFHIASVPLSASLTKVQEQAVRKLLAIENEEVLIMFIGIGNYPDVCQSTRSERRPAKYRVL